MGFQTFDERIAGNWFVVFTDSTYPNPSGLNAISQFALRFDTIMATNDDVTDHVIGVAFDLGGGPVHLGQFNVPAGAGQPGLVSVDVLLALMPATTQGLVLQPGAILYFAQYDALASGKKINISAIGGYI